jgi:hypothetical protein
MILKRKIFCFRVIFICLLATIISFGAISEQSEAEKNEYKQDMVRVESLSKSLKTDFTNDLKEYEKDINELQSKWSKKNKEYYARLMWEACKPLSSGRFSDERQYDVARRYALSALEEPNEIPLEVELELTGHVMTDTVTPRAPKGQEWANRRKQDVEIKLHAWKRLIEAIDPKWDPNDLPINNVVPPLATGLPSGIAPESIKDPKLRAEYKAAIEKNRKKAERYNEQYRLRDWLKRFPKRAEDYIVDAYSKPPFNLEELKQYLDKYIADEKTRSRILEIVKKNMAEHPEKTLKEQAKEPPANSSKS